MKSNFNYHLLIGAIACVPVYFAALSYLNAIDVHEDEAAATAVTICFLGFIYIGRYLTIASASYLSKVSNLLGILSILIAANTIWLFIHADYPLRHKPALDLLLYLLPFFILSVSLGMLITLIRLNQSRLQEATMSAIHSKSELQLLQSQLSPHFLFNTLNNLYGISISQHEKMPSLLLKLSELLRYSVYDAKELFVALKDELTYINNYIDFEKIRIGDRLAINVSIVDVSEEIKIAPMILIVFIENAFKHSKDSTDQKIYIDIELKTWADSILFSVENSYQDNGEGALKDRYSGFGLDNVKKRLKLMYPNRYDLKTEISDNSYKVMLQIKTK
jgi:sensor histidine kinase YesM